MNENQSSSKDTSYKIPEYVPQDEIWNDTWFDEKRNIFISHNEYHKSISGIREREEQKKYESESNDTGIVINPEKVKFIHNFPAIEITRKDDQTKFWMLLPTMTEDMLTKEIVEHRINVHKKPNELIHYTTVAEKSWKFNGRFGDGLTEMEYRLGRELGIYVYVDPEKIKPLEKTN